MQKIMFNDKFGLTKAVLEGKKTQTRRVIPESWLANIEKFKEDYFNDTLDSLEGKELLEQYFLVEKRKQPHYSIGETVAVAQNYEPIIQIKNLDNIRGRGRSLEVEDVLKAQDRAQIIHDYGEKSETVTVEGIVSSIFSEDKHSLELSKEFSETFALPGKKNKMFVKADLMPHQIRITNIHLQRLQDISDEDCLKEGIKKSWWSDSSGKQLYGFGEHDDKYTSPREAYAALIDKVSGKGTWEKNPWVFVYDFELVK